MVSKYICKIMMMMVLMMIIIIISVTNRNSDHGFTVTRDSDKGYVN